MKMGIYRYEIPSQPIYNPKTQELGGPVLSFDGSTVTASWLVANKTLEELKSRKLAEIATARYVAETGGVDVAMGEATVTIRTDRESQAMITGAALKATSDTEYSCRWKTVQGFVTVSAAQIVAVADAVRDHVQASFDREAELVALVNAATTVDEIEAITWD